MQRLPTGLIFLGLLLLVLSTVLGWIYVPGLIQEKVNLQVRIQNGTATFDKWSNIPVPIFLKIYLFNVTNPYEIEKGKAVAKLQEIGPYVYEQRRKKIDIEFSEDESRVRYKEPIVYYFRNDLSNGTEDDMVTFINVPLVSLSKKANDLPILIRPLINMYIDRFKEPLFVNRTVGELLFRGYKQPLIAEIQQLTGKKTLHDDSWGLFYPKNITGMNNDGEIEINTGVLDNSKFGNFLEYKNKTKLDWWTANSTCNMLNGSDGSIFPPFAKKDRILKIYSADLCRSLFFTFNSDIEYLGVPGYKFTLPFEVLASPAEYAPNQCFCPEAAEDGDYEKCYKRGTISLSGCRNEAPIVASTPHFLDGYEGYLEQTEGLKPNRTLHETFIEIEPLTGVVLRARKRIQINVDLRKRRTVDRFNRVKNALFPLFWLEEAGSLSAESANGIKTKLLKKRDLVDQLKWFVMTISCLLIGIGITIALVRARKKSYRI